jgi:hypothetical protein
LNEESITVGDKDALDECILVKWLREPGKHGTLSKAVRAILATSGEDMMLDRPKAIYEDSSNSTMKPASSGDIWGGSILLSHRVELLDMV